jgi:cytochrome c oxidase cbb3-type subunit 2
MPRGNWLTSGARGASLIAITYAYFLIFAQFAFLKRLASPGISGGRLDAVLAAMVLGGMALSLLVPRIGFCPAPDLRLRAGLSAAGAAAFLSLLPMNLGTSIAVSFLIGAGLGLLTVTLTTHLRQWAGDRHPLFLVGLGTGAGYFVCNIPALFIASAEAQAIVAGLLCMAGIGITLLAVQVTPENREQTLPCTVPFLLVLACFTALVWLDSAAFFIIQNTPALKSGTWQGSMRLWDNGGLHLGAALACAWLLGRRGLASILLSAFLALGLACLLLLDPHRAVLAPVLYPIGVSLYSVALVAYPSLLAPAASVAERGRRAGWIYAVAGWCGSAMGIGMGKNLGYIPPLFVMAAGSVLVLPVLPGMLHFLLRRKRELALTLALLLMAFVLDRLQESRRAATPLSQVERGRQVYISEGCINCHSQYVRPNSPDVLMWGPVESLAEIRKEHPPLIGNRRQGPDLAEVGSRRSALWLKAHFFNPPEVSGASIMPSYAFLFRDRRGNDLVAFLLSLKTAGAAKHQAAERLWSWSAAAVAQANAPGGERLYERFCATCHDVGGRTRLRWKQEFKRLPPDLATGPFFYLSLAGGADERRLRMAQIAKFGIPGTDMPGHEYLSDDKIASIALWLSQQTGQLRQKQ